MLRNWTAWLGAGIALLPGVAEAQTLRGFEIGPEAYYYAYREPAGVVPPFPGFFPGVTQTGPFVGVDASYTFKASNWFLTLDGDFDVGYLDYYSSGSGTLNGIWNYKGELRPLFGLDVLLAERFYISPYTGLGYRFLFESQNGRITSYGQTAYDRLSQYFYWPIGLRFGIGLGNWMLRPSVEYDYFITGRQISYFSELGLPGNLTNTQDRGYGARAEFLVEAPTSRGRIAFGPFVRWWWIDNSEPGYIPLGGGMALVGVEPKNNTLEVGGTVRFRF